MPLYKNNDNSIPEAVIIKKIWITIPKESKNKNIPINYSTFLVPEEVAKYIVELEKSKNK